MNADGVSYLDMGDAFWRGDWETAFNSVWSPMYALILGFALRLANPGIEREFALVHLVNFVIYLSGLLSFEFFLGNLLRLRRRIIHQASGAKEIFLAESTLRMVGYSLFVWSSLNLIEIWAVTPDMLVGVFVYLIAGSIVRIHSEGATRWRYGLLGLLLGLSFLAKTAMFPLAFVFMGASMLANRDARRSAHLGLISVASFLLVAGPYVALISSSGGRLTIGDAGKLTYLRHVNGIPYPHWQGAPPGFGTPEHPTRLIHQEPPIYEFGVPIGGTYPVGYDPSYWYAGAEVSLNWSAQVEAVFSNLRYYLDLFIHQQAGLVFGALVLYGVFNGRRRWWRGARPYASLTVPAVASLGMYALVLVEGRYIAPFLVLFWIGILAGVRLPESLVARRLVAVVGVGMTLFVLTEILVFNLEGFVTLRLPAPASQFGNGPIEAQASATEIASELRQLGVGPGSDVAVIGYGFDSFWARLARVQIVSEMFPWEADSFWLGGEQAQAKVIAAMQRTGAKAIVVEEAPAYASLPGWHRIESSSSYVLLFE